MDPICTVSKHAIHASAKATSAKPFISVGNSRVELRERDAREVILVNEDVIVSWFARAEQARVAIKVVVELDWADHVRVYDRAREAVLVPVAVGVRSGEKDHFVVLADDD